MSDQRDDRFRANPGVEDWRFRSDLFPSEMPPSSAEKWPHDWAQGRKPNGWSIAPQYCRRCGAVSGSDQYAGTRCTALIAEKTLETQRQILETQGKILEVLAARRS